MSRVPGVRVQDPQLKQLVSLLVCCQDIKWQRDQVIQVIRDRIQEINYKGTKLLEWIDEVSAR